MELQEHQEPTLRAYLKNEHLTRRLVQLYLADNFVPTNKRRKVTLSKHDFEHAIGYTDAGFQAILARIANLKHVIAYISAREFAGIAEGQGFRLTRNDPADPEDYGIAWHFEDTPMQRANRRQALPPAGWWITHRLVFLERTLGAEIAR